MTSGWLKPEKITPCRGHLLTTCYYTGPNEYHFWFPWMNYLSHTVHTIPIYFTISITITITITLTIYFTIPISIAFTITITITIYFTIPVSITITFTITISPK